MMGVVCSYIEFCQRQMGCAPYCSKIELCTQAFFSLLFGMLWWKELKSFIRKVQTVEKTRRKKIPFAVILLSRTYVVYIFRAKQLRVALIIQTTLCTELFANIWNAQFFLLPRVRNHIFNFLRSVDFVWNYATLTLWIMHGNILCSSRGLGTRSHRNFCVHCRVSENGYKKAGCAYDSKMCQTGDKLCVIKPWGRFKARSL